VTPGAASALQIQEQVLATQGRAGPVRIALIAVAGLAAAVGGWCWSLQIRYGMGLTGLNRPVAWATYITDFVFWVGIAHSGTLLSAILFLFRARFRTAVYRVAEAMTVFAVLTAGLFPVIHLGRPWFASWRFPYPNPRQLWSTVRSPLVWDVFAVSTYFIVSSLFLLLGIIPDAASLRDVTRGWRRRLNGLLAARWRGTAEEWRHYDRVYLLLAAFATPLVVSVHSVVSWDFAMSIVPGWHSTLFPPYFVAGAILSGVAMVIFLLIPLRRALKVESLITNHHLDMLSRLLLLTSLIVTYSYLTELWLAWRAGPGPEQSSFRNRVFGALAPLFWTMVTCNSLLPLSLFLRRVRQSPAVLWGLSLLVILGMWLERFVIIVSSLSHDYLPFDWRGYRPTLVEVGVTAGSFGWFFFWFLLFITFLPGVSIAETKAEAVFEHQAEAPHAA